MFGSCRGGEQVMRTLAFDVVALVVYAATALPALTGIPLHEWLGLGLLLVFVVHCALHVDGAIGAARRSGRRALTVRRGMLALDVCLVTASMAVVVSGIGVSGSVLQAVGLYAEGYYVWAPLHAVAAKMLLALVLVHVALHAASLYNRAKRGIAAHARAHHDGSEDDEKR